MAKKISWVSKIKVEKRKDFKINPRKICFTGIVPEKRKNALQNS